MSSSDVLKGINPITGEPILLPIRMLTDGTLLIPGLPQMKLATVDLVDLNNAATPTLYTVPNEVSCVITAIVMRKASISLTTVSLSIGWTAAAYTDVLATATHAELTGPTLATVLAPKTGMLIAVPGSVLKLKNNILQGAPATASFDIFGMLL
jgi:hypothetical protein